MQLLGESPAGLLLREPGPHVVAARELAGSVLGRLIVAEHSKAELDTAPDEGKAASERRGLGPHRGGELLLVRERVTKPGGQDGAASGHQRLDDIGVRQDRCLGDIASFEGRAADNELEPLDSAALERLRPDAVDRRQRFQLLDHAVEMDHGAAPAAEIRSRGSSRVATDESRTRSPT